MRTGFHDVLSLVFGICPNFCSRLVHRSHVHWRHGAGDAQSQPALAALALPAAMQMMLHPVQANF